MKWFSGYFLKWCSGSSLLSLIDMHIRPHFVGIMHGDHLQAWHPGDAVHPCRVVQLPENHGPTASRLRNGGPFFQISDDFTRGKWWDLFKCSGPVGMKN